MIRNAIFANSVHAVGRVDLTIQYRDCFEAHPEWEGSCRGGSDHLVEKLWDIVPPSIVSMQPYGLACYCPRGGECRELIDDEDVYIGVKHCDPGYYKISDQW